METIGTTEIADRLTELLGRTAQGEVFEILQDGRPVGRLVPPPSHPVRNQAAISAAVNRLKTMHGRSGRKSTDFRAMAHEGHRY